MELPTGPVTLSVEQVAELYKKFSTLRHDVNNHLAMIVAAAELMKVNPDSAKRMANTLAEQPPKIVAELSEFSAEFEKALKGGS